MPNDGVLVPLTLTLGDSEALPVPDTLCEAVNVPNDPDRERESDGVPPLTDVDADCVAETVAPDPDADTDGDVVYVPPE